MEGCGAKSGTGFPGWGRPTGRMVGHVKTVPLVDHRRRGVDAADGTVAGRANHLVQFAVVGQPLFKCLSATWAVKLVPGHDFLHSRGKGAERALRPGSGRHLALTLIVLGLFSGTLGKLMVRSPSSNSALALSARTALGRPTDRSKVPVRCSRIW